MTLTWYFVMGYHEHIWFHQCQEDINSLYHFERIPGNIPACYLPSCGFYGPYTMDRNNYIEIHPTQAQVAQIS
jgi:hypothetical protein